MRSTACAAAALALFAVVGCGAAVAPVRGRVTCNGGPVPEAVVIFSPVAKAEGDLEAGKAAQGGTDADGRFTLSTYSTRDGALVGRHKASVVLDNTARCACGHSKVVDVEVKRGDNEINIEMKPTGR